MEKGHPWAVLLLAAVVLFSGTFLLTRFIPESLHLKKHEFHQQHDMPSQKS